MSKELSPKAPSSMASVTSFLAAIDGGMIHSFVRRQNKTVSVQGFGPETGPLESVSSNAPFFRVLANAPPEEASSVSGLSGGLHYLPCGAAGKASFTH